MFVRWSTRHSWWQGLVEERHWEVTEIERPRFNPLPLTKLLNNPLRRLFRKPALTGAADDYGDGQHLFSTLLDDGLLSISDSCRSEEHTSELQSLRHLV